MAQIKPSGIFYDLMSLGSVPEPSSIGARLAKEGTTMARATFTHGNGIAAVCAAIKYATGEIIDGSDPALSLSKSSRFTEI